MTTRFQEESTEDSPVTQWKNILVQHFLAITASESDTWQKVAVPLAGVRSAEENTTIRSANAQHGLLLACSAGQPCAAGESAVLPSLEMPCSVDSPATDQVISQFPDSTPFNSRHDNTTSVIEPPYQLFAHHPPARGTQLILTPPTSTKKSCIDRARTSGLGSNASMANAYTPRLFLVENCCFWLATLRKTVPLTRASLSEATSDNLQALRDLKTVQGAQHSLSSSPVWLVNRLLLAKVWCCRVWKCHAASTVPPRSGHSQFPIFRTFNSRLDNTTSVIEPPYQLLCTVYQLVHPAYPDVTDQH
ncbi:hypothetical protein HPB51_029081 [Rhipicephalus microplus]|uniref:Uncharacterized protein n=1 Tax=Rhipicephalus microplus TaxID=6941 RepID=A0A9J6CVN5_RHIMP|nr:hypothetical protein HPB51_029081 [Rhipicephalus microplus]